MDRGTWQTMVYRVAKVRHYWSNVACMYWQYKYFYILKQVFSFKKCACILLYGLCIHILPKISSAYFILFNFMQKYSLKKHELTNWLNRLNIILRILLNKTLHLLDHCILSQKSMVYWSQPTLPQKKLIIHFSGNLLVNCYIQTLVKVVCCCLVTKYCLTLQPYGLQHTRLPCPSPFPRVVSNSCLLNQVSYAIFGEGNGNPVFLPGESQGRGSLVGCRLWGRTESDTTEVT